MKYDYRIEAESFKLRMDVFFRQHRVDPKIKDTLHKLRMNRNIIVHAETRPLNEISISDLEKCLDYVFSIKK